MTSIFNKFHNIEILLLQFEFQPKYNIVQKGEKMDSNVLTSTLTSSLMSMTYSIILYALCPMLDCYQRAMLP